MNSWFLSPGLRRLIAGVVSIVALRCTSPSSSETSFSTTSSSPSWVPVSIRYARGFTLDYSSSYPVLGILGANDTTRYLLLPSGASLPESLPSQATVIRTPVQRVVATSTTHLGLVEWLEARDCLVGIGRADLVYDSAIRQAVQRGQIEEVGTEANLNVEQVLALQPDLVMVSATPGVSLQQYHPLISAGIPVIVNAEWQEASPLGKAEWVKLMAALLQREDQATRQFRAMARRYDSLVQQVRTSQQPRVITGAPFQGTWYVPGRNSYVGQLLVDAHASWPWQQDTSSVSINVALETMYEHGLRADYWINTGLAQQLSALAGQDDRLTAFRPYQQRNVYNHYRRISPSGGNDFYEGGTVRPDLVLADLVEIFHPEVLEHRLYYYQKLE